MKIIDKELLEKIGKEAELYDWLSAFGGKSKGNRHLRRVNKIASYLQQREGGDEFIVLAAAWVHDVALVAGNDDEEEKIKWETTKFLSRFPELGDRAKRIVSAVSGHETASGQTIEAKIVHDADVVDKSGVLGVIRHVWKTTNMIFDRILTEDDTDYIREHLISREKNIFTDTARSLVEKLNTGRDLFFGDDRSARKYIPEISKMSMEGMISDNIALYLVNKDTDSFFDLLKSQLQCTYLD